MKKIAAILLLFFAFLQAGPAINSFFSETITFSVIDEEKGEEKVENDQKDKKDITSYTYINQNISQSFDIAFHPAQRMLKDPYLENLTPPPNFC